MDLNEGSHIDLGMKPIVRRHDYVSPGLAAIIPDAAFPDLIVASTSATTWPYLRRWVEHNWYADRTDPTTGFACRDEAAILYNSACLFHGKPSLEIGCWRGWSAVHIALGTGMLDVIDPLLDDPAIAGKVRASLKAAGVLDQITLHAGFSPQGVDALAQATGKRWAFAFVDGNHDGDAPRRDAEAVMRHAADTAMVLFHDLASPHVAAGLQAMRDAGWRTMLYQTMQIMGVAWRGDVEPVRHQPDAAVFWTLPRHLHGYDVSGWRPPSAPRDPAWWDGMTMEDRRNVAMVRAQEAEDDAEEARAQLRAKDAQLQGMDERMQAALAETISVRAQLDAASDRIRAEMTEADCLAAERDAVLGRSIAAEGALARMTEQIAVLSAQVVQADRNVSQALVAKHEARLAAAAGKVEAAQHRIDVLLATRAAQEARVQTLRAAYMDLIDAHAARTAEDVALLSLARLMADKRLLTGLLRRSGGQRIAVLRQAATSRGINNLIPDHVLASMLRRRFILGLLRRSGGSAEGLVASVLIRGAHDSRRAAVEEKIAASQLA